MTTRRRHQQSRGSVLIIAMVILFALAAMTLALSHSARIDAGASANRAAILEASAIARGAEAWVAQILTTDGTAVVERPESEFEQRPLGRGYFWIVRPDYGDPALPRFGLTDEAGKLNLNAELPIDSFLMLPGMTDEVAAGIIDWVDEDDEAEANGAESQHYLALDPSYQAKNAPFEFVEELLLVRGVDRTWLYGDPAATLGGAAGLTSLSFGEPALIHGVFDFLTVHSLDPGLTNDGEATINATQANERDQLLEAMTQRLTASRANEIVDSLRAGPPIRDLFDLYYRAQMEPEELRLIEDLIRTTNQRQQAGLVNVNTAPREVLLCVEDLTEDAVDTLLARRPEAVAAHPRTMTWVVEALGQQAIGLGEHLTARSYQYTADIVAVSGNGRGFRRVRTVFDASGETPRVIYRRDVTHLGWPLDPELLSGLRRGDANAAALAGRML